MDAHTHRHHIVLVAPEHVQRFAALQVSRNKQSDSRRKEEGAERERERYSVPEKPAFEWLQVFWALCASGSAAPREGKLF